MNKKYFKTKMIESMEEFARTPCLWYVLRIGNRERTVHREMLKSQQYRTLLNWINSGMLYATRKDDCS